MVQMSSKACYFVSLVKQNNGLLSTVNVAYRTFFFNCVLGWEVVFDGFWCAFCRFCRAFWCILVVFEAFSVVLVYFYVFRCNLLYFGVFWCIFLYFGVILCSYVYFGVCFAVFWCISVYFGVCWCTLVYFAVFGEDRGWDGRGRERERWSDR